MTRRLVRKVWLKRCRERDKNKEFNYNKSKFRDSYTKIKIYHVLCRRYFKQTIRDHLKGSGCNWPDCISKKLSTSQLHTNEQVLEVFKKIHGKTYIYPDQYRGINDKNYIIKCRIHGNFKMTPNHHKQGHGCKKCAIIRCANSHRYTFEQTLEMFNEIDFNGMYDFCLVKNDYINNLSVIKIKHKKCGTIFSTTANRFKNGHGCPTCKSSKGERKILIFLEYVCLEQSINFFPQKTFDGCEYKQLLKFDVYIVNGFILNKHDGYSNKWAVEYDGRQHIEIVEHWGSLEDFIIRAKCDAIKNKYCEDNSISLIRIPHTIKTQEEIDLYLEDKFYNSTFEELVEHNKNLEKSNNKLLENIKIN